MRDKTHMESVIFWAEYVKTHKDWKKKHTAFINSQYAMHKRVMNKITAAQKEKLLAQYLK